MPTERLVAAGHKAIAVRCDVTNEAQVKAMVEQPVSAFGRLDAAFNNAGVQSLAVETADATSRESDQVNAINLRSVWLCVKYELLQMRKLRSAIASAMDHKFLFAKRNARARIKRCAGEWMNYFFAAG